MYHPTVVTAKIDRALATGYLSKPPEYHSRQEVERATRHLDSTRELGDDGQIHVIRPFTQDEIAWMRNERFLCRTDFEYFQTRYIYIKNMFDEVVQFSPWVGQRIFMDVIADMELAQIAIMIQQLKARQLGISREVSNIIMHRTIFFPHVNAIIGSSTPAKTLKLLDMFEFPFDRLPFWMVPDVTARRRDGEGGFLEFGKMDTGITLQHGAQMSGIARGNTPTVGHLTELAEFDHPESIVDASLLRAMHDSVRTLLILEGTGEGYNWWYRKWISAKEGYPEHRSRLRPSFLPWFVGRDLYPTEAWLRAHPVPARYNPPPYIQQHARKAKDYVQSSPELTKYLGSGWDMPVEQMWFYEVEYDQAKRENRVSTFLQEMPASDDEAFQTSNSSVFEAEVVTAHSAQVRNPVGVFGLIGPPDEVPYRLQPHASLIDPTKPAIPVLANWGRTSIQYHLVPLRWNGYSTDSGLDKIYLWEMPQPGEVYGLGVDTSYGVGRDRTTIEIMRKGNAWQVAAQVGEFCSDKLNAIDATPFCLALGTLFAVPQTENMAGMPQQVVKQPRMAIECKGNGDQTQLQLRFKGWSNFHRWQRIDNKKLDQSQFNKIGIYTNEWFRAGLMEFMLKMLRDMELEIRSPYFIREMSTLETSAERQKIEAMGGEHDDRFMSLGFVVVSLYQWEKDRPISMTRPHPTSEPTVTRHYARCPLGIQEKAFIVEDNGREGR